MLTVIDSLKKLNDGIGKLVAWLTVPMVLGMFIIVVLRYALDLGWIWMQESIGWMHAAVFMLAAAYTLNQDEHVRVDIFYARMPPLRRAWVDLLGAALFLLPMAIFIIVTSWEYVSVSWQIREGSREAGGLPYPWVPLLKTLIPVTAALLGLQSLIQLVEHAAVLLGRQQPGIDAHAHDREGL